MSRRHTYWGCKLKHNAPTHTIESETGNDVEPTMYPQTLRDVMQIPNKPKKLITDGNSKTTRADDIMSEQNGD